MHISCKHCLPEEGIDIPHFNVLDKQTFTRLRQQSPIQLVKHLSNHFSLSAMEAKYFVTHINEKYGCCNRCAYTELEEEYTNCPKCGALNTNWNLTE